MRVTLAPKGLNENITYSGFTVKLFNLVVKAHPIDVKYDCSERTK